MRKFSLTAAVVFTAGTLLLAASTQVRIVRISALKGNVVEISHQPSSGQSRTWKPAMLNLSVVEGDSLETGLNSAVEVQFECGSAVRLAPASAVVFTMLERSESGVPASHVAVQAGRVFFSLRNADAPDFQVDVPDGELTQASGNARLTVAVGKGSEAGHVRVTARAGRVIIHALDSSATEKILESPAALRLRDWSRDGRYLIAQVENNQTHDIAFIDVQEKKLAYVLQTPADELMPSLSPDGKWLAYMSLESGSPQIYVTRFPSGEGKWQMTTDGGADPRWSSDGARLFFLHDHSLHSVEVHTAPTPQAGIPVDLPITPADPDAVIVGVGYGATPDGRFIALRQVGETPPNPLHLIVNWAQLLPR